MVVLKPPYTDSEASAETNLEKFKTDITASAFAIELFTNNLKMFKYVKYNWFKFYITCDSISYDMHPFVVGTQSSPRYETPGIHQLLRNEKFYIRWDLNQFYADGEIIPAAYTSDIHSKILTVGSKKPIVFYYRVPVPVRIYVACATAKQALPSLPLGNYLEKATDFKNFAVPNQFSGGATDLLRKIGIYYNTGSASRDVPLRFVLNITCYANVTFRGRDTV